MKDLIYIIYKLTRNDGQVYIGITNNERFYNRLYVHYISKRFMKNIFCVEILETSKDISILEKEQYYISLNNSFIDGLNKTRSGKGWGHNSLNFTTLGYKFPEEVKKKISESNKKRFKDNPKLRKEISIRQKKYFALPEIKKKMSELRKGKQHTTKLKESQILEILDLYYNIKPLIYGVGTVQRNGKKMSYLQAFSIEFNRLYDVSSVNIKKIILGETWINVFTKFKLQNINS